MKANKTWGRVQSAYGMSYLDINEIVAITKRNEEEDSYDIHMASGSIFTTPHLMPFMQDIMTLT